MTSPVALEAEPFPIAQVRLLAGPFKEQQDVHAHYLLMVDPDRLLAGFREKAGLPAKAKRYGGWESRDRQRLGACLNRPDLSRRSTCSRDDGTRAH